MEEEDHDRNPYKPPANITDTPKKGTIRKAYVIQCSILGGLAGWLYSLPSVSISDSLTHQCIYILLGAISGIAIGVVWGRND